MLPAVLASGSAGRGRETWSRGENQSRCGGGESLSPPPHTSFPPVKCRATLGACGRQLQQRDRKPPGGLRGVGVAGAGGPCGPECARPRRTHHLDLLSSSSPSPPPPPPPRGPPFFFVLLRFVLTCHHQRGHQRTANVVHGHLPSSPRNYARACCEDERGGVGSRHEDSRRPRLFFFFRRERERHGERNVQGREQNRGPDCEDVEMGN